MATMEDRIERLLEDAYADAERARKELDAAHASGKETIQVICAPGTKRGDIVDITQIDHEVAMEVNGETDKEAERKKARVVICHEMTGVNPETFEMHRVSYAWCYLIKEGDITTEEDFAALYADDESVETSVEEEEVEVEVEEVDPNVCSCGANREMCERNQNVFGGHLNG